MARLRFIGHNPHRLTAGGVVLADVVHGTEFNCPDAFVAPIIRRGTLVEVVTDEVPPAALEEPVEVDVEEPEIESLLAPEPALERVSDVMLDSPQHLPAFTRRSKRRGKTDTE